MHKRNCVCSALTFDMRGGRKQAKLAYGRPLDGRVRRLCRQHAPPLEDATGNKRRHGRCEREKRRRRTGSAWTTVRSRVAIDAGDVGGAIVVLHKKAPAAPITNLEVPVGPPVPHVLAVEKLAKGRPLFVRGPPRLSADNFSVTGIPSLTSDNTIFQLCRAGLAEGGTSIG